ncbi:MAG: NUDIX domain-containing protein [Flavobacteriaceae bacterium]|nr:NUDIX domain-containing protein [Flavobacteriaceae bacterium]
MYVIFKNNCSFFLTNDLSDTGRSNCFHWENCDLTLYLNSCDTERKEYYIYYNDLEKLFEEFKQRFVHVLAAGGLVLNKNHELLMIYRNDTWDLPKGKVEKDEEIEAAAVREVEEECGLEGIYIDKFAGLTYHLYEMEGKQFFKTTYWYMMGASNPEQIPKPQLEEGITKVSWMGKGDLDEVFKNTYPNIKRLIGKVLGFGAGT